MQQSRDMLQKTVKDMGFISARTIIPGVNDKNTDLFLLRSYMLEDKHGMQYVEDIVAEAIVKNAFVIVTGHHLDNKTYLSTPPELFEQMVQYVRERVEIVTVAEGTKYLKQLKGT